MSSSYYSLNNKYNILLNEIAAITPPVGGYLPIQSPTAINQTVNGNLSLTATNFNVNNPIIQTGAANNITQNITTNTSANTLKSSTINGDLTVKPVAGNGAIKFYDIAGTNVFSQITQSSTDTKIDCLGNSGTLTVSCKNANTSKDCLILSTSTGANVLNSKTDNLLTIFNVVESNSNKNIGFIPNSNANNINPVVLAGDNQIVCSSSINNQVLVAGVWSTRCNGLKVDGLNQTTSIGQGGTNGIFNTGFSCNGVNSTIIGPAVFSSTTAPTSAQSPPLASNDTSDKIPTTSWVQSAISANPSSPMPYYQANYFLNAPSNFDRYGIFQFNFTGTNWGINDFFSFSLRCSLITTTNNTINAPNYATFNTVIDVYPARCPANNTNPSAYGVNPTQPNTTNFSLLNGSIYNGGLQSAYVITSNGLPYAPYGRWYWSNNYSIWTTGTAYPTTSPAPISPYIVYGTPEKSAFGFGLWGSSFVYSEFNISIQLLNKGPNGVGQDITLSSNYTLGGGTGNTLNEVKVGL